MISSKRYSVLGWLVWQIGKRVAKRKLASSRPKLIAAAAIAVVVLTGLALAAGDDE